MKILVVGGAGYIGSVCAELLLDEGHAVAVFDNLTEGHRTAVDSRAEFIEGDLGTADQIRSALRTFQPDAIMHFAASALVGESMENPSKYFRNNVANGLNLLDAMVETGTRQLVFSSTCAIFGPPERVPIDETLPTNPINPYGESNSPSRRCSIGSTPSTVCPPFAFVISTPPAPRKSSAKIIGPKPILFRIS
jgi:UDP-glucose 4-epimerase